MKGGLPTATTYYKKHKISKGETIAQSLKERFDYGQNPDKTEGGELISSYGCDHMTADAEFLLSKAKYKATTIRTRSAEAIRMIPVTVLCRCCWVIPFHLRFQVLARPGRYQPDRRTDRAEETAPQTGRRRFCDSWPRQNRRRL